MREELYTWLKTFAIFFVIMGVVTLLTLNSTTSNVTELGFSMAAYSLELDRLINQDIKSISNDEESITVSYSDGTELYFSIDTQKLGKTFIKAVVIGDEPLFDGKLEKFLKVIVGDEEMFYSEEYPSMIDSLYKERKGTFSTKEYTCDIVFTGKRLSIEYQSK